MTILTSRLSHIPTQYPWALEYFKTQNRFHWIPEEIPMSDDVRDWKTKLTGGERKIFENIFRAFTRMDQLVLEYYSSKITAELRAPEVRMMLASFSAMEAIHVTGYSHLITTLGLPDSIFESFQEKPHIKNKCQFLKMYGKLTANKLAKANSKTYEGSNATRKSVPDTLVLALICFSMFGEGILLYGSFGTLASLARLGMMKATSTLVQYSIRDEELHVAAAAKTIQTICKEYNLNINSMFKDQILDMCKTVVELEEAFLEDIFNISDEDRDSTRTLSFDEAVSYVKYIADLRLQQLGLDTLFGYKENPVFRKLEHIYGSDYSNFFEEKSTSYAKAYSSDWSGAFDYRNDNGIQVTSCDCTGCD